MKKTVQKSPARKPAKKRVAKSAVRKSTAKKATARKRAARKRPAGKNAERKSTAATVETYLDKLPEDRREVMTAVRQLINRNLPKGYQETINWGMISYEVPLERHPNTYNGQPLAYLALAAQKNYFALYLLGAYSDTGERKALERAFADSGKKMDMGKSCLRFRTLDDLPLPALGKLIAGTPVDQFIERIETIRAKGSQRSK